MSEDSAVQPFKGLKVLDFFWVVIGPLTTSYLAEYGATVVRIESRERAEVLRSAPPFGGGKRGLNRSGYYANYNVNKYGFGLNMGHPQAVDLVKRFLPWADVVTENFTPGTIEKWGLGYDVLRAIKPDLIMISASMLGRGGPYSRQPGFGPVLSSLSGMTDLTGWPDRAPSTPYGAYTDFVVPRFALPTLVAALDYRRRTGQGQHIDISQLEAALHFMAPPVLDYANNGHVQTRVGNRHPSVAPHGVYPCLGDNRWCAIACMTEAEWRALYQVMGQPAWASEARFATLFSRKQHEDALDQLLGAWTQQQDAYTLMTMLQRAGVPAGVAQTNQDLIADPQLAHRGYFVYMDHPGVGYHPIQRSEFRLSDTPAEFRSPAPNIGQHTVQVCKEILGMADEEIASLIAANVLEVPSPEDG
ncbi:MAG: CoA transferase [Candidatus Tectomicrobia bacterium]|uniref:CoA transferase n=1 Tax=Tectimicrobiota bacterium TaxID=2528274 RepID=A0A937W109_UNCTE|nr:CoA transferase [Candidatus Tectomicrobia bacterium]